MVKYEGLFFEGENLEKILSLEKTKLDMINDEIHCTFKYRPTEEELHDKLVGKYFDVILLGYGCDGKNSGFQVDFQDELKEYYKNTDPEGKPVLPHITASIREGEEACNTKKLNFILYKEPIYIKGRFGYYLKNDDETECISYEQRK